MPGFRTALRLGVDTLELDLHLTADDRLAVWHDPTITPDKCHREPPAAAPPRVRDLPLDAVREFVCDRNPDPGRFPEQRASAGADYRIPSLDEVLRLADDHPGLRFNIELKRDPGDPSTIDDDFDGEHAATFELALVEAIRAHRLESRAVVQSFDHRSLAAVHSIAPELELAALTEEPPILIGLRAYGASIWSPDFETLTPPLVDEAHELGLRVIPWTVNEPDDIRAMIELGVDGIISDRPDLVLEMVGRTPRVPD